MPPEPIGKTVKSYVGWVGPVQEFMDGARDIRARHVRCWQNEVAREVRLLVMDGLSPETAEQAAKNNLAVKKAEIDQEMEDEVQRLIGQLGRRLLNLLDEEEDQE